MPPQNDHAGPPSYLLPASSKSVVMPLGPNQNEPNPAADLIRHKLKTLYAKEPDAEQELAAVEPVRFSSAAGTSQSGSKHQQFMRRLSTSGLPIAEIQTKWHEYYTQLPDDEKHAVWQEFYDAHAQARAATAPQPPDPSQGLQVSVHPAAISPRAIETVPEYPKTAARRSVAAIKQQLLNRVTKRVDQGKTSSVRSLAFGVSVGGLAIFFLLFGFFNERFIAPFITPSRTVSATPIIIDPSSTAVDPQPRVIIPKINVEIPVVYDDLTTDEKVIQTSLQNGVIHYPTTSKPGEVGNAVFFGHSSNNILNPGRYKFAFVLLSRLEAGDIFYLTSSGKRYAYKIYDKKIVKPSEVSVLGNASKSATATLITCDPPGTSLNRLVVVGEQISPDPAVNVASSAQLNQPLPTVLPSNAPSLWQRFTGWFRS